MQVKSVRTRSYRSFAVDDTTPAEAFKRLKRIETYQGLRAEVCSEATALRVLRCSRSTYFRWLKRSRAQGLVEKSRRPCRSQCPRRNRSCERHVWALRCRFPFMGKRPSARHASTRETGAERSTVGRILDKGLRLGRSMPCAYCRGRTNAKRRRSSTDTLSAGGTDNAPNAPENSFGSITCRSPGTAKNSRSSKPSPPSAGTSSLGSTPVPPPTTPNASSRSSVSASRTISSPPKSMAAASSARTQACRNLRIPLYVLPPRRPQFNGCVERANDTTQTEFWNLYDGDFTAADAKDPGRVSVFPQPYTASPTPRLENPKRVSSKHQELPLSAPHPLNPHTYGGRT